MELTKCNPNNVKRVRSNRYDHFNTLFDDFFTPFFYQPASPSSSAQVAVDIYEREGKIVLEAEIPGVNKEDIHVDVKGKTLTIGAERKADEEVTEESRYRRERRYGKIERSFALPFFIKEENVAAKYDNGLLILEISKPEEEQKKQITIQ